VTDLDKSKNIQATIRANLAASANTLIRVPEIENESPADAIRKLQIQVFELSDAIAQMASVLEQVEKRRFAPKSAHRYP